ncbi:rhodanese-like domain-containing protein [Gordonia sp. CPCC 206044]|uniref:rhodanese-like domain-containing protein n=1 Tax=Gordonia sp. CPCC 206044 TaxID=3140793 RepID=UPI003AF3A81F
MTAVIGTAVSAANLSAATVSAPAPVDASAPVTSTPTTDAPLSVQATAYTALVAAGITPVDVRSQRKRDLDGVLSGALAIDATEVLPSLTPGTDNSLRIAAIGARWLLVSDDGHEAEWLAWHLQARGVSGAVFVVGGYRALRRSGVVGTVSPQELAAISAH